MTSSSLSTKHPLSFGSIISPFKILFFRKNDYSVAVRSILLFILESKNLKSFIS